MKKIDLNKWAKYAKERNNGISIGDAAARARISRHAAYSFERGDQSSSGIEAMSILGITSVAGNLIGQPLTPEAAEALKDFAAFRFRYFGRKSMPWQERAAYDVLRYLESPDRDYLVVNMPPGSGKSTLFTNDIPCWLIARDRTIRIQIGSRTERQARMYVSRIKRSLERDAPLRADADSLANQIAWDAEACLQDDYGAFKPEGRSELWRAEALVCRQLDGVSLDDKEPTVSAWGQDSGFLGGRFDLVIWDDLVDRRNTRSADSKTALKEWWSTEAETRLEPGGVLILQGQRIAHDDLYREALDERTLDEQPKYKHIVYKAHDTDRCTGDHTPDQMKPWPEGCLLDPHRLPWKMLETIHRNNPRTFAVQYQQEDGDLVGGLIHPAWVEGGLDDDGYNAPGILDKERSIGEIPEHLTDGRGWSIVTVDPSPTEWWGIGWWIFDPDTGRRYAIDLIRRRLNPEQFLALDLDTGEFSGVIEDIRQRSNTARAPIRQVVFEINAAQRWLMSQPHVQRWMKVTGVVFVPHTTSLNKADPKFGVESIGDLFRQGQIRLPWHTPSDRLKSNTLISEALRYPDGETSDMVMMTWFMHLACVNGYTPNRQGQYATTLPGFMGTRDVQRGLAWAR